MTKLMSIRSHGLESEGVLVLCQGYKLCDSICVGSHVRIPQADVGLSLASPKRPLIRLSGLLMQDIEDSYECYSRVAMIVPWPRGKADQMGHSDWLQLFVLCSATTTRGVNHSQEYDSFSRASRVSRYPGRRRPAVSTQ